MAISLIIVAHNEEKYIAATIKSAYDLVDEIILVDAACTDGTVKAVEAVDKEKKLKVYHHDNPPNFIINKQRALDKATKEWVLELDADEIVTPALGEEIAAATGSDPARVGPSSPHAYWLPRLNHFMNIPLRKGGQFPDYTIRLYQRTHARFPLKTIHDQVQIDGLPTTKNNVIINDTIQKLASPLLHYPYRDLMAFFRKWAQYAMYDGDEWYVQGMRPSAANFFTYCVAKPLHWFLLTYFRHRGYTDGFAGLAFSFFSGLRFWVGYMRMFELTVQREQKAQKNRRPQSP